ncbi:MAG: hypothetical protein AVDCRST_MAG52-2112, partial [uncultured Blastococcus sp.]
ACVYVVSVRGRLLPCRGSRRRDRRRDDSGGPARAGRTRPGRRACAGRRAGHGAPGQPADRHGHGHPHGTAPPRAAPGVPGAAADEPAAQRHGARGRRRDRGAGPRLVGL